MNQTLCTSVLALIALIWAGSSTAQVRDQEGCTRDYSFTGNQAVIRWQLTDEERARTDTRELAREIFDQKYPNGGAVAQSYAIHFIEVPNAIPPVTRAVLYICVELAPIASASNPATSSTSTSISTAIPSTRPTLHDGGILQSSELEGCVELHRCKRRGNLREHVRQVFEYQHLENAERLRMGRQHHRHIG